MISCTITAEDNEDDSRIRRALLAEGICVAVRELDEELRQLSKIAENDISQAYADLYRDRIRQHFVNNDIPLDLIFD